MGSHVVNLSVQTAEGTPVRGAVLTFTRQQEAPSYGRISGLTGKYFYWVYDISVSHSGFTTLNAGTCVLCTLNYDATATEGDYDSYTAPPASFTAITGSSIGYPYRKGCDAGKVTFIGIDNGIVYYGENTYDTSASGALRNFSQVTWSFATSTRKTMLVVPQEDTHIRESAKTTNYATSDSLLGCSQTNYEYDPLIRITGMPSEKVCAQVLEASLFMHAYALQSNAKNVAYKLCRVRINYTNSSVTWNTYNGTSTWTTAGAKSTTNDIDTSAEVSFNTPSAAGVTHEIDVKSVLENYYANINGTYFNMKIYPASVGSTGLTQVTWGSSERTFDYRQPWFYFEYETKFEKSASDTCSFSLTESIESSAEISASDICFITIEEAPATVESSTVIKSASDTLPVVLIENALLEAIASGLDPPSIFAVDEVVSLIAYINATETIILTLIEQGAVLAQPSEQADSASLAISEAALVQAEITGTEDIALSLIETAKVEIITSDSFAISASDSSDLKADLNRTDTANISVIEAQSVSQNLQDNPLIQTVESGQVDAAIPASDTPTIILMETAKIDQSTNDAANIGLNESASILAARDTSDTAKVGISESSKLDVSSVASEEIVLSLVETAHVDVYINTSDIANVGANEAIKESTSNRSASDSGSIGVQDVVSRLERTAVDTANISLNEELSILAQRSTSDIANIELLESAEVFESYREIYTSDTIALVATSLVGENKSNINLSDALQLALTEAAKIDISASDTTGLSLIETTQVQAAITAIDEAKVSSAEETHDVDYRQVNEDIIALQLTENSQVNAQISAALSVPLILQEAAVVNVQLPMADNANVLIQEASSVSSSQATSDTASIGLIETAQIEVITSDEAKVGVEEAVEIAATLNTNDTCMVAADEAIAALTAEISSSDGIALSAQEEIMTEETEYKVATDTVTPILTEEVKDLTAELEAKMNDEYTGLRFGGVKFGSSVCPYAKHVKIAYDATDFTFEMFVRLDACSTTTGMLGCFGSGNRYIFLNTNGSYVVVCLVQPNGTSDSYSFTVAGLKPFEWNHFVFVFDVTNKKLKLFVNGVFKEAKDILHDINVSTLVTQFGTYPNFNYRIANTWRLFRKFTKSLTDEEAIALYGARFDDNCAVSGAQLDYNMMRQKGHNPDAQLIDYSGNGNHATLYNMTWDSSAGWVGSDETALHIGTAEICMNVQAAVPSEDNAVIGLIETANVEAVISASDDIALSLEETRQIDATLSAEDSVQMGVEEDAAEDAPIESKDTAVIAITETVDALAGALTPSETANIILVETAKTDANATSLDAASMAIVEEAEIKAQINSSDTCKLSLQEVASVLALINRNENIVLDLITSVNQTADVPAFDNAAIGTFENAIAALLVSPLMTDYAEVKTVEDAAITAAIPASDTCTIGLEEKAIVEVLANDEVNIGANMSAETQAQLSSTDRADISISEERTILANLEAQLEVCLSAILQSSVVGYSTAKDKMKLATTENTIGTQWQKHSYDEARIGLIEKAKRNRMMKTAATNEITVQRVTEGVNGIKVSGQTFVTFAENGAVIINVLSGTALKLNTALPMNGLYEHIYPVDNPVYLEGEIIDAQIISAQIRENGVWSEEFILLYTLDNLESDLDAI